MTRIALSIALLAVFAIPAKAQAPERVVSINLCSDILALELAAPGQLRSVFRVAADAEDTPNADKARGLHLNDASAEEVLAEHPDLVLAHEYTSPFVLALLARAHVPVVQVKDAATFDEIADNVRLVASALGAEQRGEAWIARFRSTLNAAKRDLNPDAPRALIYQDLGGAAAANTILGSLLEHAGFENVVKARASGDFVNLSIEDVIEARPDFVAIGSYRVGQPSLARAQLSHPALRTYIQNFAASTLLPAKLWNCSTPFVAELALQLARANDALRAHRSR
jgi:iron complex transport system substrate-binding protein